MTNFSSVLFLSRHLTNQTLATTLLASLSASWIEDHLHRTASLQPPSNCGHLPLPQSSVAVFLFVEVVLINMALRHRHFLSVSL
ncbi:hypothetical protein MRB53_002598 [Persea americana]|uniref:Uncharacterized protein n=1 Tax=Persea americana TaxID=3435 RepID=A0ACC2MV76_PERAE|nr:hypothetical protein MRB53_002598 [Persea americana]